MICPYCDSMNPDDIDVCKVCEQRFVPEINFEGPVRELNEISNRMIRRDIPADPWQLQDDFEEIENEIQDILDQATEVIEQNILDVQRMRENSLSQLGELNLSTFNQIFEEFSLAQNKVTEGLRIVKTSLIDAKTSDDVTRGLSDYSKAVAGISEGLSRIEKISAETGNPFYLTNPPKKDPVFKETSEAAKLLDMAAKGLEGFEQEEDPDYLLYGCIKAEQAYKLMAGLYREFEKVMAEDEIEDSFEEEDETFEDETSEIELVYMDTDEIVSDDDLESLMKTPEEEDYREILMDPDWRSVRDGTKKLSEDLGKTVV